MIWAFLFNFNTYNLLTSFAGKETLRCLALALKRVPLDQHVLSFDDEKDLTFIGLVCFLHTVSTLKYFYTLYCRKRLVQLNNSCLPRVYVLYGFKFFSI